MPSATGAKDSCSLWLLEQTVWRVRLLPVSVAGLPTSGIVAILLAACRRKHSLNHQSLFEDDMTTKTRFTQRTTQHFRSWAMDPGSGQVGPGRFGAFVMFIA